MRKVIITIFIIFSAGVLALSIGLYASHGMQSRGLLESSIENQLKSTVVAAKEKIDTDAMLKYTGIESYYDAGTTNLTDEYKTILEELRRLKNSVGAYYIYTIMDIGGEYHLIYDTDEVDEALFVDYTDDMSAVHFAAYKGELAAGIMNVTDEYGSYHTAAMPLYASGAPNTVAGIVCVDILDDLYEQEITNFVTGIITLSVVLTSILVLFGAALLFLLNHIRKIQENLNKMAHYDKLTDLPNRRYLLEQLAEMTARRKEEPFALFFIDLDNFKKVNDNAGHDAGDELLRHIAAYLQNAHANSNVFRMSAGAVNVTARVGGDEFIMIVPGMKDEKAAGDFAQELLDGFAQEHIDKYISKYEVGLSIGIALYPEHISNFHTLINYADAAMYYAKKAGKNRYRIYTDEMSKKDDTVMD